MYPALPKNRLIVNNIDLTEEYGMILLDGYKNNPPTVKSQDIDIPGRDGKMDLSELLLGRPVYNSRTLEFSFICINVADVELKKTEISVKEFKLELKRMTNLKHLLRKVL